MRVDLVVISFLGALAAITPLPWYWRARNVGIITLIFWLFCCCMIGGINAIVWGNDVVPRAKIWCDIAMKIMVGANTGIPISTMCICRFLSQVASPRQKMPDANDRRRRMIFELSMCVGVPVIFMALHYIVQGNRFDIVEEFGCQPVVYVSVAALLVFYLPPWIIGAATAFYAAMALRWFIHRRKQFQAALQSSQSGLTPGKYLRLIVLALTELLVLITLLTYVMVVNIDGIGLQPWVSWAFVHADWQRIGQYAKILLNKNQIMTFAIFWYTLPISSFIFFSFFGFGQEARAEYHKGFVWVKTHVFRMKPKPKSMLPVSARLGATSLNSMTATTPTIIKLETETTVSTGEKWDDAPASAHTTSRPESPSRDAHKEDIESQVRS